MSGFMCVLMIQTQALDASLLETLFPQSHLFSPEAMSSLNTCACFPEMPGAVPQSHYHLGHYHPGHIIRLQCDIVDHH